MYRYGQRCDACVWPHGLSAAPLQLLQCLVLSRRCELLAAIGVSRAQRCYCVQRSTCAQPMPACTCSERLQRSFFAACKHERASGL